MRYNALDGIGGDIEFFERQTLFQLYGYFGERVVRDIEDNKSRSEYSEESGEKVDEIVPAFR